MKPVLIDSTKLWRMSRNTGFMTLPLVSGEALNNTRLVHRAFQSSPSLTQFHRPYLIFMAIGYSNVENSKKPALVSVAISLSSPFTHRPAVFREAHKPVKAMIAYEKSLDWRELFEIAIEENIPKEDLSDTAYRLAGKLCTVIPSHSYL